MNEEPLMAQTPVVTGGGRGAEDPGVMRSLVKTVAVIS